MYKRRSKELISSLLRKICSIGDTYEHHKESLDYKTFLEVQLELIEKIVTTERRISKLKKETPPDSKKIEEARERRRLLKLLGTTVAWILLEFDRPYIRNFARGHDSGFISGKKGLKLEILALKAAFELENCAAVLHDITNCLRVGDLSVVKPEGIRTLELKLVKGKRKPDRRERRQTRRGKIIREFYDKGISTKIIPGMESIQHVTNKFDKHNWHEMSTAIKDAINKDYGVCVAEDCMVYMAFQNEILPDELFRLIKNEFKDPLLTFGCHDRHIRGISTIMPFTCFDIPLLYKQKLLFSEVGFCVMLDFNSLSEVIEKRGFRCKVLKDSGEGVLEVSDTTEGKLGTMGYGLINRLLYECLSIETIVDYMKEMPKALKEDEMSE